MSPVRVSVALTVVATALVFAAGLDGALVWDDVSLVTRGPTTLADTLTSSYLSTGGGVGYYRPLSKLVFFAGRRTFGEDAFAFHVVSLALHLAVVALAGWWITARLRRDGQPVADGRGAVALGLALTFFAIHPSRAENVSWISGLTDPLFALPTLLALVTWERRRDLRGGLEIAALTLVALAAKETASALPLALALDAGLRETASRTRRASWGIAAGSLAVVVAFWFTRLLIVPLPPNVDTPFGADGPARVASTIGHYVAHLTMAIPSSMLSASRHVDAAGHEVFAAWSVAVGAIAVAAVIAWAVASARFAASRKWFADFALAAWFIGPVLNVVPLNLKPLVAERFLYFPSIALACLAARALSLALARTRLVAMAAAALALVLVGTSVTRTVARIPHFRSEETMFRREHALAPLTALPIEYLANLAAARGDDDGAIALYSRGFAAAVTLHDETSAITSLTAAARLRLRITSDASAGDVRALRRFYDALGAGRRATLALPDLRAGVTLTPRAHEELLADTTGFVIPWADARARDGDVDGALEVLASHATHLPSAKVSHAAMRVLAWEGRAEDVAARARALATMPSVTRHDAELAREVIVASREIARVRATAEPTAMDYVREANALLALGAPGRARGTLARMREALPGAREAVLLEARIHAADGRVDLGRAALERAARDAPGAGWDRALRDFERETARVAPRR